MKLAYVNSFNPKKELGSDVWYIYPVDSGQDFDYRARVSANWFFLGKGRNHKKDGTIYFYDNERAYERTKELAVRDSLPPVVEKRLNNIWEFYKEIGYDYKKQKWL